MLFDWAGQPFYTVVTTFIFAPYFTAQVAPDPATGQSWWGYASAAAGLVIALASPALGAIADETGRRKAWLLAFSVLFFLGACGLWRAEPGGQAPILLVLPAPPGGSAMPAASSRSFSCWRCWPGRPAARPR